MHTLGLEKIVSGGQTGVDRAALDVAIALGIPHGGWCPKGRLAEDGTIDAHYQLVEHASPDYAARTRQNVIDSDATLILYRQRMTGGTALTNRIAHELGIPMLRVRLDVKANYDRVASWIAQHSIKVLNVAGPRGSSHPELYGDACDFLTKLFQSSQSLLNKE